MKRIKATVVAMVMACLLPVTAQAYYCGDVQVALLYAEYSLDNCRLMSGEGSEECFDAVYSIINALQNALLTCDPILQ